MYHFCTYFDQYYLPRGLALYQSLQQHCPKFKLWVLCMDPETTRILAQAQLPNIEAISLEELERAFPQLLQVKPERTRIEYYFTCTPLLSQYIVTYGTDLDMVTYLDADTFFFADPKPIFDEMAGASIGIIEHRYPQPLRAEMDRYGIYNVGWVTFRCDREGLDCLRSWCDQCLEWCYDRLEGERYADQKYLEEWPRKYDGVHVIQHKGANVAPWNFANYRFQLCSKRVHVDEQPLIFFHFHGFKRKNRWLYDTHAARYGAKPSFVMRKYVIEPYIQALDTYLQYGLPYPRGVRRQLSSRRTSRIAIIIERIPRVISTIFQGQQVIVINKRVLF